MRPVLIAALLLLIAACSEQNQPKTDEHVWKDSVRVLDQAKELEQATQKAAQERAHALEEQAK